MPLEKWGYRKYWNKLFWNAITWHCVTLVQPLEKRSNIKREFFFQLIPRLNVTFHIEELTWKICIPFWKIFKVKRIIFNINTFIIPQKLWPYRTWKIGKMWKKISPWHKHSFMIYDKSFRKEFETFNAWW